MDNKEFFTQLETLLKEEGLETYILKTEDPRVGDALRTMVPVTEEGDHVLTEFMLVPYTEDALLLQIYTTMIAEIGSGFDALKDALLDWNLTCPLGAFGIYRQLRQLYHKYNYLLPLDADPGEMAEEVFYILNLVHGAITAIFPEAANLSGEGKVTPSHRG